MKILIHCINYLPELTGIGKYTGEMAEWLAGRGHNIRVVTASPYYPAWKVSEGYKSWLYRREVINEVDVWRCPLWVPAKPSGLKRLLHLASFAISSFPIMLWQAAWHPDIVLVVEPPLFCAPQAWVTARISGSKAWLHIQDFEVDAAFELGLLPNGQLRILVNRLESWLMRRFDGVSTISDKMIERLKSKNVAPSRCVLFPNWVDTSIIYPMNGMSPMRLELSIPEDAIVVLYSGNMGEKQGLEIIVEAARILADNPKIFFLLCGDGAARHRLIRLATDMPNISFLPLQPAERLNELLNVADIHLLPQRADTADLVMPSKLLGMLASGRPVITTAYQGTQVAQTVDGCGIVVPPGNPEALAGAILHLVTHTYERERYGSRARESAAKWGRDDVLGRFEIVIKSLANEEEAVLKCTNS